MDPEILPTKRRWKNTGFVSKVFWESQAKFLTKEQTKDWTCENNTGCSGQRHVCISCLLITNLLAYTSWTGMKGAHTNM